MLNDSYLLNNDNTFALPLMTLNNTFVFDADPLTNPNYRSKPLIDPPQTRFFQCLPHF